MKYVAFCVKNKTEVMQHVLKLNYRHQWIILKRAYNILFEQKREIYEICGILCEK
jgi:hypothetical protein